MRLVGSFSQLTQLVDAYDGLFTNRAPIFHGIDAFVLDLGVSEGHVFDRWVQIIIFPEEAAPAAPFDGSHALWTHQILPDHP